MCSFCAPREEDASKSGCMHGIVRSDTVQIIEDISIEIFMKTNKSILCDSSINIRYDVFKPAAIFMRLAVGLCVVVLFSLLPHWPLSR
jgi:hypothetical protein